MSFESPKSRRIKVKRDMSSENISPGRSFLSWHKKLHSHGEAKASLSSSSSSSTKKLISPGYLIDNETLDILTNQVRNENPTNSRQKIPHLQPPPPPPPPTSFADPSSSSPPSTSFFRKLNKATLLPAVNVSSNRVPEENDLRNLIPRQSLSQEHKEISPNNAKNYSNHSCVFCDEPIRHLLLSNDHDTPESIIELRCGHSCHEECYNLEMEFGSQVNDETILEEDVDEVNPSDNLLLLPMCTICHTRAIPSDNKLTDELLSKNILNLEAPPDLRNGMVVTPSRKNSEVSSHSVPKVRNSRYNSQHTRKHSRGSSVSAISSIISSVSNSPSPSPTATKRFFKKPSYFEDSDSLNSQIPLALLRSKLLSKLLADCSDNLIDEKFVDSLGLLRLLDTFNASIGKFIDSREYDFYLFSYLLLIVEKSYDSHIIYPLIAKDEVRYSGTRVQVSIDLIRPTCFRVEIGQSANILITSKDPSLIEKWAAAFQNQEMLFPNELLTGSMNLSQTSPNEQQHPAPPIPAPPFNDIFANKRKVIPTKKPPKTTVMVINQYLMSLQALNILKNIVKLFLLIKINVYLVICSSEGLNMEHGHICSRLFTFSDDEEVLLSFWDNLSFDNPVLQGTSNRLSQLFEKFFNENDMKRTVTVVLSNLKLGHLKFQTDTNVLMEVGLPNGSAATKNCLVTKAASWDEVMEKLCSQLGLDFDAFQNTDTDYDTDVASLVTRDSKLTLSEQRSRLSVTTESDSDAEIITELLDSYAKENDNDDEGEESNIFEIASEPPTIPASVGLNGTPILAKNDVFDEYSDTPKIKINTSPLTPQLRLQKPSYLSELNDNAGRWSALFSDIEKVLDETTRKQE